MSVFHTVTDPNLPLSGFFAGTDDDTFVGVDYRNGIVAWKRGSEAEELVEPEDMETCWVAKHPSMENHFAALVQREKQDSGKSKKKGKKSAEPEVVTEVQLLSWDPDSDEAPPTVTSVEVSQDATRCYWSGDGTTLVVYCAKVVEPESDDDDAEEQQEEDVEYSVQMYAFDQDEMDLTYLLEDEHKEYPTMVGPNHLIVFNNEEAELELWNLSSSDEEPVATANTFADQVQLAGKYLLVLALPDDDADEEPENEEGTIEVFDAMTLSRVGTVSGLAEAEELCTFVAKDYNDSIILVVKDRVYSIETNSFKASPISFTISEEDLIEDVFVADGKALVAISVEESESLEFIDITESLPAAASGGKKSFAPAEKKSFGSAPPADKPAFGSTEKKPFGAATAADKPAKPFAATTSKTLPSVGATKPFGSSAPADKPAFGSTEKKSFGAAAAADKSAFGSTEAKNPFGSGATAGPYGSASAPKPAPTEPVNPEFAADFTYSFLKGVDTLSTQRPKKVSVPADAFAKMTKMERQFWQIKAANFDLVLFVKMGRFYEVYDCDAVIFNRELDVKLNKSAKWRYAGVPSTSFDKFASKILAAGYKVGRVEEVGEKEPGSSDLVPRKLVETLLPEGGEKKATEAPSVGGFAFRHPTLSGFRFEHPSLPEAAGAASGFAFKHPSGTSQPAAASSGFAFKHPTLESTDSASALVAKSTGASSLGASPAGVTAGFGSQKAPTVQNPSASKTGAQPTNSCGGAQAQGILQNPREVKSEAKPDSQQLSSSNAAHSGPSSDAATSFFVSRMEKLEEREASANLQRDAARCEAASLEARIAISYEEERERFALISQLCERLSRSAASKSRAPTEAPEEAKARMQTVVSSAVTDSIQPIEALVSSLIQRQNESSDNASPSRVVHNLPTNDVNCLQQLIEESVSRGVQNIQDAEAFRSVAEELTAVDLKPAEAPAKLKQLAADLSQAKDQLAASHTKLKELDADLASTRDDLKLTKGERDDLTKKLWEQRRVAAVEKLQSEATTGYLLLVAEERNSFWNMVDVYLKAEKVFRAQDRDRVAQANRQTIDAIMTRVQGILAKQKQQDIPPPSLDEIRQAVAGATLEAAKIVSAAHVVEPQRAGNTYSQLLNTTH